MSKNYSFSAMPAINNDDYMGDYEVNLVNNKLNKQSSKKNNDFNNEIQLRIKNRILQMRSRDADARYSLKNRRTVNKDWKDFNNNQSIPEEANWNWDLSFDCDSDCFENSSIRSSRSSSVQVSPTLSCVSSSSYLKSFDIPWVEL
jgi:hypothetical protein